MLQDLTSRKLIGMFEMRNGCTTSRCMQEELVMLQTVPRSPIFGTNGLVILFLPVCSFLQMAMVFNKIKMFWGVVMFVIEQNKQKVHFLLMIVEVPNHSL